MNKQQNEPSNWKWNIFYFNSNDKRVLVPKRIPILGWTLNFANPYSGLILIAIFAFAILVAIVSK